MPPKYKMSDEEKALGHNLFAFGYTLANIYRFLIDRRKEMNYGSYCTKNFYKTVKLEIKRSFRDTNPNSENNYHSYRRQLRKRALVTSLMASNKQKAVLCRKQTSSD